MAGSLESLAIFKNICYNKIQTRIVALWRGGGHDWQKGYTAYSSRQL